MLESGTVTKTDRVRLHISPFNSEIADRLLPSSVRSLASNLSFHAIETFPEKGFGYVDLPQMEAEKLKKKLNGTVLKGTKIRIETARPEKKRKKDEGDDVDQADQQDRKKARNDGKDKTDKKKKTSTIEGHELTEGRHVKRGWEELKKRKDKKASKNDVEDRALLFKTKVPPNSKDFDAKAKTSKEEKRKKKDKKGKKENMTVVKEFSKHKKPGSLVDKVRPRAEEVSAYEEGKGWIDDTGDVVEAEPESLKRERQRKLKTSRKVESEEIKKQAREATVIAEGDDGEEADSSDVSSEVSSELTATSEEDSEVESTSTKESVPIDAAATEVNGDAVAAPDKVHPLEALFKRPSNDQTPATQKVRPGRLDTSFSFFGSGVHDSEEEDGVGPADATNAAGLVPHTPHTKLDLEWRGVRSAAPTPDTAAIGKRFRLPVNDDDGDDEEEEEVHEEAEEVDEPPHPPLTPIATQDHSHAAASLHHGEPQEESEFRKWFYEHRGDLNRGWKKRRREERKAKRQRENRKIGRRVV